MPQTIDISAGLVPKASPLPGAGIDLSGGLIPIQQALPDGSVPVFDPSGAVRAIPSGSLQAALNAGGKRAIRMTDPSGTMRYIPEDLVGAATQAGGKLVTPPPTGFVDQFTQHAKDEQAAIDAQPTFLGKLGKTVTQGLSDEGNTVLGAAKGAAHTLAHAAQFVSGLPIGAAADSKLQPTDPYQQIGRTAEQTAEFLAPGAAATKVASGANAAIDASTAVPAFLRLLGKAAVTGGTQAAASGATSALQGDQNPGTSAAIAGGMGAAGELASPLGPIFQKAAQSQYGKFLNPTKQATKYEASQVVPQLLDRGVVTTSGEALSNKAGAAMNDIGSKISNAVQAVPPSVRPRVQNILDSIDAQKSQFLVSGVPPSDNAQAAVDALDKAKDGILNVVTAPGSQVSYQSLNQARKILDSTVANAGGYMGKSIADTSSLAADKAAANAIRAELARQSPDISALNKEFHFWAQVKDVIDQTNARRVGQQGGLGRVVGPIIGAGAGIAHGGMSSQGGLEGFGAASIMLAANEAIRSPFYRTASAVIKNALANAIASGNVGQVTRIAGQIAAGGAAGSSSK